MTKCTVSRLITVLCHNSNPLGHSSTQLHSHISVLTHCFDISLYRFPFLLTFQTIICWHYKLFLFRFQSRFSVSHEEHDSDNTAFGDFNNKFGDKYTPGTIFLSNGANVQRPTSSTCDSIVERSIVSCGIRQTIYEWWTFVMYARLFLPSLLLTYNKLWTHSHN